eukprot:SAG31_NODE_1235_length_9198_cov_5.065282_5_plen_79_part_00
MGSRYRMHHRIAHAAMNRFFLKKILESTKLFILNNKYDTAVRMVLAIRRARSSAARRPPRARARAADECMLMMARGAG